MNSAIIKPAPEPIPAPEYRPSTPPPEGFNFRFARSFRMHKALAVSVAFVVSAAIIALGLSRHPQFEAHSLIYVQPITAKLMTDASGGSYDATRYDSYIQQQLETIIRPDILSEALKNIPIGYWQAPGESEQSAILRLQGNLKVERVLGSYQVAIKLQGDNAATVTRVVNEVTTAFLRKGRVDELAQSEEQLQILTDERQRIQNQLEADRKEQNILSSTLGVADTAGDNGNPYDVQLEDLRKQVSSARADHEIAAAQLASVSGAGAQPSDALNAAAEDLIANDPELTGLKTSITQRRSSLTSQMAGLTPANPLYRQDEDELNRLNQSLDNMAKSLRTKAAVQLQSKLKLEFNRTADIEARLERQLAQQTAIATGNSTKLQRASDLAADILRLQARFTEIDNADRSIELQRSASALIHLSLPALQPQSPQPTKKRLLLLLAVPLGCGIGLASAVARQMLDPRVYIAEDLKNALKFQPMAVLPDPMDVNPRVVEEFMLRFVAGIDQAHRNGEVRTYVFTAVSPGVPITDLIASLAAKMNDIGYRTIILEASAALHKLSPDEEKAWETPRPATGLSTQIVPFKRENFVVENLQKLKQSVDILFIEALPILTSAEAEFVARLADATVLIAGSSKTTRKELKTALALVRRLGVSGVAAVLNDVNLRNADDDFLRAVRSVEGREPGDRRR